MGEWKMPPYPVEKNGTQNARKGRLYARRKKKDRRLEALTGQASVTRKADPSMRKSRTIVVQLAWQMNRRCRPKGTALVSCGRVILAERYASSSGGKAETARGQH